MRWCWKATLVAAGALAVLGGSLLFAVQRYAAASRAETEQAVARLRAQRAEFDRRDAESPQDRRLRIASDVWGDFDSITEESLRTKETLATFLHRANRVADALPESEAAEILEVIVAGERGLATGDGLSTLVPSADPERCEKLAERWLRGEVTEELREAGFRSLECGDRRWSWESL